MSFVHLHTHSEYSWLDGACCLDNLVQRAVQYKMPAVAITDRNSVAGASRLWQQCLEAGIKPIIGLEIAVLNNPGNGGIFSVILLAKNGSGYAKLCRLISLAFEVDPCAPIITKSQLREHSGDLICLSFSVVGELCTLLLEGKDEQARQVSDWYHEVFGEDYYYEIQDHGLPSEAVAMNKLLNLAKQTKIPVVFTNDCHYMDRKDSVAIDTLNCLRKGLDFAHPEAKRFACNEYYFKSPKEMKALASFPPQLLKNTLLIAAKIDATEGFIPVPDSDLEPDEVVKILRDYSTKLRIGYHPRFNRIGISLCGIEPEGLLERLSSKLPDHQIMRFTDYDPWTPRSIYSAVLNTLKVPEEKIRELCGLIPGEANILLEAVLKSTDFSCLSSEDYVCATALEIGDTLINTYREERPSNNGFVLIPKGMTVPIVRNIYGQPRCQYDLNSLAQNGLISLELKL